MPQRDHSSVLLAGPHSTGEQDWQRLVEERFPADLQDQAQALKGFQRARGLPSALHLLRGLLYYVLSHSSLRDVSVWSRLIGLTSTVLSAPAAPASTQEQRLDAPRRRPARAASADE